MCLTYKSKSFLRSEYNRQLFENSQEKAVTVTAVMHLGRVFAYITRFCPMGTPFSYAMSIFVRFFHHIDRIFYHRCVYFNKQCLYRRKLTKIVQISLKNYLSRRLSAILDSARLNEICEIVPSPVYKLSADWSKVVLRNKSIRFRPITGAVR